MGAGRWICCYQNGYDIVGYGMEWMEEVDVAIVHFEVCMWLGCGMLGIRKGSEDRGCVFFSTCSLLWFMHVGMVTSALHDAKKQGLLGFMMHVLCGGERAVCNARLFYGIWPIIEKYDMS